MSSVSPETTPYLTQRENSLFKTIKLSQAQKGGHQRQTGGTDGVQSYYVFLETWHSCGFREDIQLTSIVFSIICFSLNLPCDCPVVKGKSCRANCEECGCHRLESLMESHFALRHRLIRVLHRYRCAAFCVGAAVRRAVGGWLRLQRVQFF